MGVDFSYNCTSVSNVRELGVVYGKRVVRCDLQFEDEHGHDFAPVQDALVVVDGDSTRFVETAEDVLPPDECSDEEWDRWGELCDASPWPGYDFYNPAEVAQWLSPKTE